MLAVNGRWASSTPMTAARPWSPKSRTPLRRSSRTGRARVPPFPSTTRRARSRRWSSASRCRSTCGRVSRPVCSSRRFLERRVPIACRRLSSTPLPSPACRPPTCPTTRRSASWPRSPGVSSTAVPCSTPRSTTSSSGRSLRRARSRRPTATRSTSRRTTSSTGSPAPTAPRPAAALEPGPARVRVRRRVGGRPRHRTDAGRRRLPGRQARLVRQRPRGGAAPTPPSSGTPTPDRFLPMPVQFHGMPSSRWWELEDARTDFGAVRPNATDLGLLLLAEFALIYADDWFITPVPVPVGAPGLGDRASSSPTRSANARASRRQGRAATTCGNVSACSISRGATAPAVSGRPARTTGDRSPTRGSAG